MNDYNPSEIKDISFLSEIQNIAIIGVSKSRNYFFLKAHQENFNGKIFAINPKIKIIPGFDDGTQGKIFPSIKDIPEPIDFAFIAVAKEQILKVIDDCVEKGVKLVSIFTSEFSDSGTEEGIQLEKELIKHAKNKVKILGPNGMGLYYPKKGIAWRLGFPSIPGRIGLICQSGGLANLAIFMAKELGLTFSKVFSFGNGADLDFVDLLAYLSKDNETDHIIIYLEGIKEGRGKVLRKVLEKNKKPIILLKGGVSNTGQIAAKTHTAALTGKNEVWDALFKQFGVIQVETLTELLSGALILDYYGTFKAKNFVIVSISGGYGVMLTDLVEKYGLNVPKFNDDIQKKIDKLFYMRGTSPRNPIDFAAQFYDMETLTEIFELALSDKKIDAMIFDIPALYFDPRFRFLKYINWEENLLNALSTGQKYHKPIFIIIQRVDFPEIRYDTIKKLRIKKIPVFGQPKEFLPFLQELNKNFNKGN